MNLEHQLESKQGPTTMELLLDEAIQTLPPDEQAGLAARFFEGKDFQEIAGMFSITEDAARKRTSRCLAKLQNFMARRGAAISMQTLSGLLLVPSHEAGNQALESAIHAIHAAWKGKVTAAKVVAMANHIERLLHRRLVMGLTLRLAVLAVFILTGIWSITRWNRPAPNRIEELGQAWGALDKRVASHTQFLAQTPPNTPGYQARVQQELGDITRESSRIIAELNPLLARPDARARLAGFLTAELAKNLNLNFPQRTNLFSYIQTRLAQGATLNDAMRTLAETSQNEAGEIKAILSPAQRQLFEEVYGTDGVLLFSYPKAVAMGKIGG